MADILIRGMEMPKDCGHCRFAVDGWCYAYGKPNIPALAKAEVSNFCPLVPLPEKHGRLIDGDAVIQEAYRRLPECEKYGNEFEKPYEVIRAIETAKTIVPAEGGDEDG